MRAQSDVVQRTFFISLSSLSMKTCSSLWIKNSLNNFSWPAVRCSADEVQRQRRVKYCDSTLQLQTNAKTRTQPPQTSVELRKRSRLPPAAPHSSPDVQTSSLLSLALRPILQHQTRLSPTIPDRLIWIIITRIALRCLHYPSRRKARRLSGHTRVWCVESVPLVVLQEQEEEQGDGEEEEEEGGSRSRSHGAQQRRLRVPRFNFA